MRSAPVAHRTARVLSMGTPPERFAGFFARRRTYKLSSSGACGSCMPCLWRLRIGRLCKVGRRPMARPLDEGHGHCRRWFVGASLVFTALLGTTLSSPRLPAQPSRGPRRPGYPYRRRQAHLFGRGIHGLRPGRRPTGPIRGAGASGPLAETWTYDGETWAKQSPLTARPLGLKPRWPTIRPSAAGPVRRDGRQGPSPG